MHVGQSSSTKLGIKIKYFEVRENLAHGRQTTYYK